MLSLVLPTSSRPQFLARCLRYYQRLRFPYPVFVADSSRTPLAEMNQRLVDSLRHTLDLRCGRYDPEIPIAEKIARVLELVDSPYAVCGADDDFFVPSALAEGVRFLERHPDHALVHGEAVLVTLPAGATVSGRCEYAGPYRQHAIELPTAAQRLTEHLRHYSTTFYSLSRTASLRANWRHVAALDLDARFFSELVPSCLSLIQGKSHKLERLYMVRQGHGGQQAYSHQPMDMFDWIADARWAGQYARVRALLADALAQQDGLAVAEAEDVVKRTWWFYLAHDLQAWWRDAYEPPRPQAAGWWRPAVQRIPGLRRAWRAVRSRLLQRPFCVESLRRPASPHYADFLPIDQALSEPIGHDDADAPQQPEQELVSSQW